MIWLAFLLTPFQAFSSPSAHHTVSRHERQPLLERQRAWFKQAREALKRNDIKQVTGLREKLNDYPLAPYLDIWLIRKNLAGTEDKEIETTLARYADIPESHDLRMAWIRHLAGENRWASVWREFNKLKSGKGSLFGIQLQALWHQDRKNEAAAILGEHWLKGKTLKRKWKVIFAHWRRLGHPTQDEVWQRIRTQMRHGRVRSARATSAYLNKRNRVWFGRWLEMRRHPEKTLRTWKWSTAGNPSGFILSDGLKRLSRKDAAVAWKLLKRHKSRLPHEDYLALQRYLAIRASKQHLPEAGKWLAEIPSQYRNREVMEWQTRTYLLHGRWRKALATIEAMPASLQKLSRWRYWKARSLTRLGKHERAEIIFAELARDRGFYSFLSAERLGQPFVFSARNYEVPAHDINALASRPGIQRAYEWLQLLELNKAVREWHVALSSATEKEWRAAATLAFEWKWHDQAILAAYKGMMPDFLRLRFPLQYKEYVMSAARQTGLPPSWILAIIRQESAFNVHARSRSGALGLMQIMPPTGRQVARQQKIRLRSKKDLLEPELNIRLGSLYLANMLERFHGRLSLASAAYNAGPHRVERWLPERLDDMDSEAWIEAIPFDETRRYVQQVLAFTIVYDWKLELPGKHKLASLL
jgi:soluble lytic murein transglycosylase